MPQNLRIVGVHIAASPSQNHTVSKGHQFLSEEEDKVPPAGKWGARGLSAPDQTLLTQVVSSYIQSEFASVRTSNSILDLFRTPAIRKVTCCLMVVW